MTQPADYNILFLGETQSGKSTLIEALQKYADLNYKVDTSNVGDGIFSRTKNVLSSRIETNRPSYYLLSKGKNERVDYGDFVKGELEDYEDELNERKAYVLKRDMAGTAVNTFNLIDTPGLNDTTLFDENNIAIIFSALESIEAVNLVVITISNNPFTEGLRDALKAYVDLLPEFNGNIVFVHTKIDYTKLHPDDTNFAAALLEKKKILGDLMGRQSVPHLLIDNDIGTRQIVRDCITQNTLRNLLGMATLNQPVPIRTMRMNKTAKMRLVDEILKAKYEEIIAKREEALAAKNQEQKDFLGRMNTIKASITEKDEKLKTAAGYLLVNDNETLELLHEEVYQQDFSILNIMEGAKPMYYPGKQRAGTAGFMHHILDHIDIRSQNIKVLQEAGGKGQDYWAVRFRRKKRQNGLYHVKIYIHRRKKNAVEIEKQKTDQNTFKGQLEDCKADLEEFETLHKGHQAEIQELLESLKHDRYLLSRVASTQLDNKVFHMLVEAEVYVRDYGLSANNAEKFYFDNKEKLESLDSKQDYVVLAPVQTSEDSTDNSNDAPATPDGSQDEFDLIIKDVAALKVGTKVDSTPISDLTQCLREC